MTGSSLFVVMAVAGFVELLRRLKVRDYYAAATIFGAAIIGTAAGLLHAPGAADPFVGLIMGLGASGAVTLAGTAAGK